MAFGFSFDDSILFGWLGARRRNLKPSFSIEWFVCDTVWICISPSVWMTDELMDDVLEEYKRN